MLLYSTVMRRKECNLGLLIITFTCFLYVTMVIMSLEFISVTPRYQLTLTCDESSSNFSRLSSLELMPSQKTSMNDISGSNLNVGSPVYPMMLWNKYLINNRNLCNKAGNISVLIVVKTGPSNFERRQIIRDTWGNYTQLGHLGVLRVLFLMGKVQNERIQENISNEFAEHFDILQGDFLDTYRNLTNKGVMGLRWITENCMQAKMVVIVDDDVVLDTYRLLEKVYPVYETKTRYVICNIFMGGKAPIVRDEKHKWYVKDSELKQIGLLDRQIYPSYCSGFTAIISTDLIPAMFGIAHITPFFWVDDVYLYGLLLLKAGRIAYHSLASNYTFNYKDATNCFSSKAICNILSVAEIKTNEMISIWNVIKSNHWKQ